MRGSQKGQPEFFFGGRLRLGGNLQIIGKVSGEVVKFGFG